MHTNVLYAHAKGALDHEPLSRLHFSYCRIYESLQSYASTSRSISE